MTKKKHIILMVVCLMALPLVNAYADGEQPATDSGATAWMLTSTALVLLMVPGLAMFYGGLVRTKNVLGTMMHSFTAMGIMTVLWVICGYSMAFGPNIGGWFGGWFGWNWDYVFLDGIDEVIMSAGIPEYIQRILFLHRALGITSLQSTVPLGVGLRRLPV
jgi:Amt family ammonium transporter